MITAEEAFEISRIPDHERQIRESAYKGHYSTHISFSTRDEANEVKKLLESNHYICEEIICVKHENYCISYSYEFFVKWNQ